LQLDSLTTLTLPGGYWIDGKCHREAELRPLTGHDEAFLLEFGKTLLPSQRTTAQLARSLTRLGPLQKPAAEVVRSLTIGDREALLLHLRRLTFGDSLDCVVNCPDPTCGEKMDLELRVSDLLLPPYAYSQEMHEGTVMQNGSAYRVIFRLPRGFDQEEAAALALTNPQAGVDLILRRCIERITGETSESVKHLPPAVTNQLPTMMAKLDPQAELTLNLSCPVCGRPFSAIFDTGSYLFQELVSMTKNIFQEVHLLASHYHWTESEILGMVSRRRHLYLRLLDEAHRRGLQQ